MQMTQKKRDVRNTKDNTNILITLNEHADRISELQGSEKMPKSKTLEDLESSYKDDERRAKQKELDEIESSEEEAKRLAKLEVWKKEEDAVNEALAKGAEEEREIVAHAEEVWAAHVKVKAEMRERLERLEAKKREMLSRRSEADTGRAEPVEPSCPQDAAVGEEKREKE